MKRIPTSFLFYTSNGLLTSGITFATSFLIAVEFGADIRGQVAFFFSILNLLISILAGTESGSIRVYASRQSQTISNERVVFLTLRNVLISTIPFGMMFCFDKLTFENFIFLSIATGFYSGLVIKYQQLLALRRKGRAFLASNGVWIIYAIFLLLYIFTDQSRVTVSNIIFLFFAASLTSGIFLLNFSKNFLIEGKNKSKLPKNERAVLTISSLATILQLNGLIIVLKLFTPFATLGIVALSMSFLNGALVASLSLVHGTLWEQSKVKISKLFYIWFVSNLLIIIFASIARRMLSQDFNLITFYVIILFPFYTAVYVQEIYLIKNFKSDSFRDFGNLKFISITTLLLVIFISYSTFLNFSNITLLFFGLFYLLWILILNQIFQNRALKPLV